MFKYEPPKPPTVTKRRLPEGGHAGSRRNTVLNHLESGWLPIAPHTLQLLKKGVSKSKIKELLSKDPLFYLAFIREFYERIGEGTPHGWLETASDDDLNLVLDGVKNRSTTHNFKNGSAVQLGEVEHSALSAFATESICVEFGLPSEKGYETALMRNLGQLLVAWNYPTLFTTAVGRSRKEGVPLSRKIKELFGMTPMEIAQSVTRKWRMGAEERYLLDEELPPATSAVTSIEEALALGKLISDATRPHAAPEVITKWHRIREALPTAMQSIESRLDEKSYDLLEEIRPREKTIETRIETPSTPLQKKEDPFTVLEEAYHSLKELSAKEPVEALNQLSTLIMPACGFDGFLVLKQDSRTGRIKTLLNHSFTAPIEVPPNGNDLFLLSAPFVQYTSKLSVTAAICERDIALILTSFSDEKAILRAGKSYKLIISLWEAVIKGLETMLKQKSHSIITQP